MRFASSRNLSVKVCKTWFESQRTCYRKLNQFRLPRKWQRVRTGLRTNLTSCRHTTEGKDSANLQVSCSCKEESVLVQPHPTPFHKGTWILTVWRQAGIQCQPQCTVPVSTSHPVGHSSVCTDEVYSHIFPRHRNPDTIKSGHPISSAEPSLNQSPSRS